MTMVNRLHNISVALLALLFMTLNGAEIDSVWELNAAINAGANNKIGFLTEANYLSVKPLFTSNVSVQIISELRDLEAAVIDGTLIAGVTSSSPGDCDNKLSCFSSRLFTARGTMFAPGLSQARRYLINKAIVTFLTNGNMSNIDGSYEQSDGLDAVSVQDCPWDTSIWNSTGLTAEDYNFRIAGLLADWGWQGNYTAEDPTGFWPEIYNAIEDAVGANFTRVYYDTSDEIMAAIEANEVDITEFYWTLGGVFQGQPRTELFEASCTVLGVDSVFFVKPDTTSDSGVEDSVVIALSVVGGLFFICCIGLALFACHIIKKEKEGNPVFMAL